MADYWWEVNRWWPGNKLTPIGFVTQFEEGLVLGSNLAEFLNRPKLWDSRAVQRSSEWMQVFVDPVICKLYDLQTKTQWCFSKKISPLPNKPKMLAKLEHLKQTKYLSYKAEPTLNWSAQTCFLILINALFQWIDWLRLQTQFGEDTQTWNLAKLAILEHCQN